MWIFTLLLPPAELHPMQACVEQMPLYATARVGADNKPSAPPPPLPKSTQSNGVQHVKSGNKTLQQTKQRTHHNVGIMPPMKLTKKAHKN